MPPGRCSILMNNKNYPGIFRFLYTDVAGVMAARCQAVVEVGATLVATPKVRRGGEGTHAGTQHARCWCACVPAIDPRCVPGLRRCE